MFTHGPSERRKNITIAVCGVGIYGGGSFVWQLPVLMDDDIGSSLRLPKTEMIGTSTGTFLGWAIGSLLFGVVADRIGRRPVVLGASALAVLHLFACAASSTFGALLAARIIGGLAMGGMQLGFALALEHIPEEQKSSRATWLNYYFAVGIGLIVSIHICCTSFALSWRIEFFIHGLVLGALVSAAAFIVPRSPSSGEIYFEMVSIKETKEEEEDHSKEQDIHGHKAFGDAPSVSQGISLLYRTHCASTAAIAFAFVAVSVTYYSLSYQAGSLSNSIELNVMLLALLDLPGYALFDKLAARPDLGVRGSIAVNFVLCGGFLTVLSILARGNADAKAWAPAPAFLGKMCCSGAFQGVYLLPSELLLPSVQSTAFGMASSCARLATAAVPSLVGTLSLSLSSLIVAVVASVASAVVWVVS